MVPWSNHIHHILTSAHSPLAKATWLDGVEGDDVDPWSTMVQSFCDDMRATGLAAIAAFQERQAAAGSVA